MMSNVSSKRNTRILNHRQRPTNRTAPPTEAIDRQRAKAARLHYRLDTSAGIQRKPNGKSFTYVNPRGQKVRDRRLLERINGLVIPPAWKNVWINPDPQGHLQATGIDAAGRKQYRYHDRWRTSQDRAKYEKVLEFARALPRIHRRVSADLRKRSLPREKVLAGVIRLLEITLIRVGNEESSLNNHTYGLTTMRDRHVAITGQEVCFDFRGKSGIAHEILINDAGLARLIKQCRHVPGQKLFQYVDEDGESQNVHAGDVNEYIRESSGGDFSAKDFRTWAATALTIELLQDLDEFNSPTAAKQDVRRTIKLVAERLGNTTEVCRKSYIHPAVIEGYLAGMVTRGIKPRHKRRKRPLGLEFAGSRTRVLDSLQKLISHARRGPKS